MKTLAQVLRDRYMFFNTQKSADTGAGEDRELRKNLLEKQHREAIAKHPELANQTWLGAVWASMSGDSYNHHRPATKKENAIEDAVLFVMLLIPFLAGIYMLWEHLVGNTPRLGYEPNSLALSSPLASRLLSAHLR
jgi:hypothetical protein